MRQHAVSGPDRMLTHGGSVNLAVVRYRRLAGVILAVMACCTRGQAQSESPETCAGCHQHIAETYRRTGMARSFYRPSPANTVPATYYHAPSDSYFSILERDGKYYQRRHQIDFAGKQVNVMEKQVDYIMGSGNHSRAYLHLTGRGRLVELPLAWYAEKGGYW